jgi:hypothetical protein
MYEMSVDEELDLRGYDIVQERIWGAAKVIFMTPEKQAQET